MMLACATMSDQDYVFENRPTAEFHELALEGTLPDGLSGSLLAIGPAIMNAGGTPLHAFDGHGRAVAATVGAGANHIRARIVDTPLWRAEQQALKMQKRRIWTNLPSRWSNLFDIEFGNNAWHNLVPWGDHVVATNDPGFFLLDRNSLETRGPTPFQPAKGASVTPMPRVDPRTGHHVVFEVRPGLKDTLVFRELDDNFRIVSERAATLPKAGVLLHDVAFSDRYWMAIQFGALHVPAALWGATPLYQEVRFDPATTPTLHLMSRSGGDVISVPLPGGRHHFHFWNAFDRDDGKVVADLVGYEEKVSFESLYPPAMQRSLGLKPRETPKGASWRYVVDPKTRTVEVEQLTNVRADAPAIRADRRGRKHRYGWSSTQGTRGDEVDPNGYVWFHALCKHDFDEKKVTVWDAGPRVFVSPPAFVAKPGSDEEDDGWLLAFLQDCAANSTSVAVFDARHVDRGPIARLTAPGLLGLLSHVSFG